MEPTDDPFGAIDRLLQAHKLGRDVDAIIVDFHCEATGEKQAMGHFCDGRVSLVVGTHTHTPSADHRVLAGGTAYITDVGMTGDYDSVVGMQKEEPVRRFATGVSSDGSYLQRVRRQCAVSLSKPIRPQVLPNATYR